MLLFIVSNDKSEPLKKREKKSEFGYEFDCVCLCLYVYKAY